MVLPNDFALAENAKDHQRFLLDEAERIRQQRSLAPMHGRGRFRRLQQWIGERLILFGEWLREEDQQSAAGHRQTPASA